MSDHVGEESGGELIKAMGAARLLFREVRELRIVASVERLTRVSLLAMFLSVVGAALTRETLARAATATAKKRERNIVERVNQEAAVRREGMLASRGLE